MNNRVVYIDYRVGSICTIVYDIHGNMEGLAIITKMQC